MRSTIGLLFCAAVLAQGHHRTENRALLGIVAVPSSDASKDEDKPAPIVIGHVLKKSPAAKAGLEVGDVILAIAEKRILKPADVDAALASFSGSEKVAIEYRRGKKRASVDAKLIARRKYKGEFLKRQARGRTGFKAPEWFVYEWSQTDGEPPTRGSTKGKVVILHCFQGW